MPNYIYRAVVEDGGKKITYRNSNGENVTFKPGFWKGYRKEAALLFNTVNKYFTGKSPNITPQEQIKMREDIVQQYEQPGMFSGNRLFNPLSALDFALNTYNSSASEGGKNITPNEVYKMFEMFHKWTK